MVETKEGMVWIKNNCNDEKHNYNNVHDIARAIRGHWMVESYHWHLDVTFREYANHTLDKDTAYNLNIVRKIALNILKLYDVGFKKISIKNKRFLLSQNFEFYTQNLMDF